MNKKWYMFGGIVLLVVVLFAWIWWSQDGPAVEVESHAEEQNESSEDQDKVDAEEESARFENIEGEVTLIRAEVETSFTEDGPVEIQPGDIIKTGPDSRVSLFFHDETSVHLGQKAKFTLERWEQEDDEHVIELKHDYGQLWNDVKTGDTYQVFTKDGHFEVKGTLFLVAVDPVSGRNILSVLDGIVGARGTNADDDSSLDIYPFVQYFPPDSDDDLPQVQLIDIEDFVSHLDVHLIEALLRSVADVRDENDRYLEELRNRHGNTNDTPDFEDIERFTNQLHAMISNIVKNISNHQLLNEEDIRNLLDEINNSNSGRKIELDNIPEFNPNQDRLQEIEDRLEQMRQQEQERRLQQERERREQQEQQRQRNDDLLNKIEQQRHQQEESRRQREREQQLLEQRQRELERQREAQRRQQEQQREQERKTIHLAKLGNQSIEVTQTVDLQLNVQPDDVQIQAETDDDNIIRVEVKGSQLKIEALREGNAQVQLVARKVGFEESRHTFQVKVTSSDSLPLGKWFFIPDNKVLQFANGVKLDLSQMEINEQSRIHMQDASPIIPSDAVLEQSGTVIDISFEEVDIAEPVEIMLPVDGDVDMKRVGLFYQRENGDWQHQPATIVDGGLQATVTQFSTYGVFTAEHVPTPEVSIEPGEVAYNTEIDLNVPFFEGAQIYYTTNGEKPTIESALYTDPITLSEDTTIKAIAVHNNMLHSQIGSFTYAVQPKQEFGTVTGQVLDVCPEFECGKTSPNPVGDAHVIVYADGKVIAESWTDENGFYEIEHVPAHTDIVVYSQFHTGFAFALDGVARMRSEIFQVLPEETYHIGFTHDPEPFFEKEMAYLYVDIVYETDGSFTISWEPYSDTAEYQVYINGEEWYGYVERGQNQLTITEIDSNEVWWFEVTAWEPPNWIWPSAVGNVEFNPPIPEWK